jgi:putative phosphoribosyl transferase
MFRDRTDAGKRLAAALMQFRGEPVVVFALPRGGVVLGVEIARCLQAPLDLIVVRKIGHPESPEYAIGAVTEDGDVVLNREETETLDPAWIGAAVEVELHEARRRRSAFLCDRPAISARGKTAIIVDDGLATGLTMEAGIHQVRKQHPLKVIVAVPVGAAETVKRIRSEVDEIVVLHAPVVFGAVGAFYADFDQLSDAEVIALVKSTPEIQ